MANRKKRVILSKDTPILVTTKPSPELIGSLKESIPRRIFQFLQEKLYILGGQCVISGSYSLCLYRESMGMPGGKKFSPSDIDFYVSKAARNVIQALMMIFASENRDIRVVESMNYPAFTSNVKGNIEGILDYKCSMKGKLGKEQKIQIILWQDIHVIHIPTALDLALSVTSRFDISVVKTALTDSKDMTNFFLLNKDVKKDIEHNRFTFTLRQNTRQETISERVKKYEDRGYVLYEFLFEKSDLVLRVDQYKNNSNVCDY